MELRCPALLCYRAYHLKNKPALKTAQFVLDPVRLVVPRQVLVQGREPVGTGSKGVKGLEHNAMAGMVSGCCCRRCRACCGRCSGDGVARDWNRYRYKM